MCIAYLALQSHADWPLFLAANRDEFHARPARPAAPWGDHPDVIAGIDEQAGGTWLGVTRQGRFAVLTNYRDLNLPGPANPVSRGELVKNFLTGNDSIAEYASNAARRGDQYAGFNLIVGDSQQASYIGNQAAEPCVAHTLSPGRYVVSNHLLDTAWPKTERLREVLNNFPVDHLERSVNRVFELLKDDRQAPDHELPQTGLPLEKERLLSSPFIISPDYGTRCSTVLAIHRSGRALFSELTYDRDGQPLERHDWPWQLTG